MGLNVIFFVNPHVWSNLLFGKFTQANLPYVDDFINSIPVTFCDMTDRLRLSPPFSADENVLSNRKKLQKSIHKFHSEAGTLTKSVSNKIASLSIRNTEIFVSTHQPNLFPYAGILKKIVLMHALKDSAESVNRINSGIDLFVILDHDFVDELWVHLAQMPSVWNSSGRLEIRLPVSQSARRKMIYSIPLPGKPIFDSWKNQVKRWIIKCTSSNSALRSHVAANFEKYWSMVEQSISNSKTYGDFNSFLMSQTVNRMWEYDTLFVRLSDMPSVFEEGYKYLIANYSIYSQTLRNTKNIFTNYGVKTNVSSTSFDYFPLWLHCNCGSKAPTKIVKNQKSITLLGTCLSCKKQLAAKVGSNGKAKISKEILQYLSPRAISLILLLSRDLGITCYCSGLGAIDYMICAKAILDIFSVKRPLIVFWPSKDIYNGIAQTQAIELLNKAHANADHPLQGLEKLKEKEVRTQRLIYGLIAERNRRGKKGEPLDSVLDNLFRLKTQQRNIRNVLRLAEKCIRALKVSPCFIDYAVNIGINGIEPRWRKSLFRCDDLSVPLLFDIDYPNGKKTLDLISSISGKS
jgi:hypothetical protein